MVQGPDVWTFTIQVGATMFILLVLLIITFSFSDWSVLCLGVADRIGLGSRCSDSEVKDVWLGSEGICAKIQVISRCPSYSVSSCYFPLYSRLLSKIFLLRISSNPLVLCPLVYSWRLGGSAHYDPQSFYWQTVVDFVV